jgi:hypothetical protein
MGKFEQPPSDRDIKQLSRYRVIGSASSVADIYAVQSGDDHQWTVTMTLVVCTKAPEVPVMVTV